MQRDARELLLDATHRAAAEGLSQREIAGVIQRSQPEVSRLLKRKPPGPLALKLVRERRPVMEVMSRYGVTDSRVFGSVATRTEGPLSDIDLLIATPQVLSLGTLSRMEREISAVLDAKVDIVPLYSLPEHIRARALAEALML